MLNFQPSAVVSHSKRIFGCILITIYAASAFYSSPVIGEEGTGYESGYGEDRKTPALRNWVYKRLATAQTFAEEKKFKDAELVLEKLLRDSHKLNKYELANIYNTYAYLRYAVEDYDGALRYYTLVLDQVPDIPLALELGTTFTVAQLLFLNEQWPQGVAILQEFLRKGGKSSVNTNVLLANGFFQLEDYESSLTHIETAIQTEQASGGEPEVQWLQLQQFLRNELAYISAAELQINVETGKPEWVANSSSAMEGYTEKFVEASSLVGLVAESAQASQPEQGRYESNQEYRARLSTLSESKTNFFYLERPTSKFYVPDGDQQVYFELEPLEISLVHDVTVSDQKPNSLKEQGCQAQIESGMSTNLRLTGELAQEYGAPTGVVMVPLLKNELITLDADVHEVLVFNANASQVGLESAMLQDPACNQTGKAILVTTLTANLEASALVDIKSGKILALVSPDRKHAFRLADETAIELRDFSRRSVETFQDWSSARSDYSASEDSLARRDSEAPATPNVEEEYLPIVKVAPVYPRRAITRGITGSCIVTYTVTASGAVEDPFIANPSDCIPAGVFERASIKAALKFKYKPRVTGGKAVATPNVTNKFSYDLE